MTTVDLKDGKIALAIDLVARRVTQAASLQLVPLQRPSFAHVLQAEFANEQLLALAVLHITIIYYSLKTIPEFD